MKDGIQYRVIEEYGASVRNVREELPRATLGGHVDGAPVRMVGPRAFARSALASVAVTEPVQTIARGAFFACKNLESVSLPSTLRLVGQGAFRGCSSLRTLALPEGVTDIKERAFKGCTNLRELSLPSTLKFVGDEAFAGCPNLTVEVPDAALAGRLLEQFPELKVELIGSRESAPVEAEENALSAAPNGFFRGLFRKLKGVFQ